MGVRQHAEHQNTESPAGSLAPSARLRVVPGGGSLFAKDNTQMPNRIEVKAGERYGRLVIVRELDKRDRRGQRMFLCKCDCGNHSKVRLLGLRNNAIQSCGCISRERSTKHRACGTPTYLSWEKMKARCTNANAPDYDRYGGRGIHVCDRWMSSFENFLEDMGERPKATSLDRINNSGDYDPDNCRWASRRQQGSNMRSNRFVTFRGETLCLSEWARRTGMDKSLLRGRLERGWSVEDALTKPVRAYHRSTTR